MKTKYIVLIIVFVLVISAGAWLYSLSQQLRNIKPRINSIQLAEENPFKDLQIDSIQNVTDFIAKIRDIDLIVEISLANFTKRPLVINQAYVEIYDQEQSILLGRVLEPIQKVTLQPDLSTSVFVKVRVKTINILRSLFGNQNPLQTIQSLIMLTQGFGDLGKSLKVKGFIRIKNNLLSKNFEKTVNI